jgi:hypothetical protein
MTSGSLTTGLAGSVLETRLRNASSAFAWCPQNQDWSVAWVTLTAAARPDCLLSNLAVFYDEATDTCVAWNSLPSFPPSGQRLCIELNHIRL